MNNSKNVYEIISDIGYVAVIPTVSTLGLLFNVASAVVLANKLFKETMYRFLLANSIIDAIYLFIISFLPVARCFDLCNGTNSKYIPKFYELYGFLFTTHLLSTMSTLTSLSVSFDRYFSLSKINRCTWKYSVKLMLFFFFCISLINQLPTILTFKLTKDLSNNTTINSNASHFIIGFTKFGALKEAKLLIIILQANINLLPTTLVIIVNILLLFKLRQQAVRVKRLYHKNFFIIYSKQLCEDQAITSSLDSQQNECNNSSRHKNSSNKLSKIERNLTSMIVFISILYVLGRLANTSSAILFIFYNRRSQPFRFFILVCNIVEFSTYGMNIFIFHSFNKSFALILNRYLNQFKSFFKCKK